MKKLKNDQGITLVALIVTIIILLILAGVTIALLSGEDGILSRTEKSATTYQTESIKEVVNLKLANLNAGKWIDEGRKAVLKDLNELDDENSSNFDAEITLKYQVGDSDTSAILVYDHHEVEVDSLLNIVKIDGEKYGGTSGETNNGESGSTNTENSSAIDSAEYAKLQEIIAQLQQKVATLEMQSATKAELGTIEENYATKVEMDDANDKITSAQNQIDSMLTTLDVDTRTTLFEGTAGTAGTYNLSDISEYKYLIIYADGVISSGRNARTSMIINTNDIKYNNSTTYVTDTGYAIGCSNGNYYYLGFWFKSSTQFYLGTVSVYSSWKGARIYKIEGIK